MPIAGFDPSLTNFGWIILDEHKTGKDSLVDFGIFKTDTSYGVLVQRLILQRERVRKFLKQTDIRFISMEAPYFMDFNTELLFSLNQFIHEVFLDLNAFVLYVPPIRLKKIAVPEIKISEITKHHVIHQAKTELDMHGKRFSEHVSDAYFAAKIGIKFYRWHILKELKDEDLTEEERKLFCGKHIYIKGAKKGTTEYTGIIYKENDQFFDYTKYSRKSEDITKEILNG